MKALLAGKERLVLLGTMLMLCLPAAARTIVLDVEDCDRMAAISESGPRLSWAMHKQGAAVFTTAALELTPLRSLLIRFPLNKIPVGQRIVYAQLTIPVTSFSRNEPRFYLWRLLSDWGHGVSHTYRRTRPDLVKWVKPGARGSAGDRAPRPTDIVRLTKTGDIVINVTEDVELWHTGVAANQGWLLTVEDPGTIVSMLSPTWCEPTSWRLRITYEPVGKEDL